MASVQRYQFISTHLQLLPRPIGSVYLQGHLFVDEIWGPGGIMFFSAGIKKALSAL